jgi:hypothetical protein
MMEADETTALLDSAHSGKVCLAQHFCLSMENGASSNHVCPKSFTLTHGAHPVPQIKPICIITGANTGLGYRAAEILASSKYDFHVILACRTMEKAIAAAQSIRQQV